MLDQVLNFVLVVRKQRLHNFVVEDLGSIEIGEEEPDEEEEADPVPVWNEIQEEADVSLKRNERAEYHPVSQPRFVVVAGFGLNGSDRL